VNTAKIKGTHSAMRVSGFVRLRIFRGGFGRMRREGCDGPGRFADPHAWASSDFYFFKRQTAVGFLPLR
jgi:hypothetical protein